MNYKVKNKIQVAPELKIVLDDLMCNGARVYFVGGIVRDLYIAGSRDNDDIDIEIYQLELDEIITILQKYGKVNLQGKVFGVIKIDTFPNVDFAMPRIESKVASGHKGFLVEHIKSLSLEEASKRRDFTMNALLYDYQSDEVIDLYNGIKDIQNNCIRLINENTFIEDPLRVLRAAQFASRFQFYIEESTKQVCRKMVNSKMLSSLSESRVQQEYRKLMMSSKPSIGLRFLKDICALPGYLIDLDNTIQRLDYHPEGSVFEHTMLVVDLAALLKERTSIPEAFMWSCLLHDIGKAKVTTKSGSAPYHNVAGVDIFKSIEVQLFPKKYEKYIEIMILCHMKIPYMVRKQANDYRYLKLLEMLDGIVPLDDLIYLSKCDKLGRGNDCHKVIREIDDFIKDKKQRLTTSLPVPLITGKMIVEMAFIESYKRKEVLNKAYDKQLRGSSKEEIMKWIISTRKVEKNEE